MKTRNADEGAKAYDAELDRHVSILKTWTYKKEKPDDLPMPHLMSFKAKPNLFGGLENTKYDALFEAIA